MLIDNTTAAPFIRRIGEQKEITVDLETTGLRPYKTRAFPQDRICGVAVLADGQAAYFPVGHAGGANVSGEVARDLYMAISSVPRRDGHNLNFDNRFLGRLGVQHPRYMVDTLLGSHLYNENERHGLKPLSDKYLSQDAAGQDRILAEKLMAWGYGKGDMWRLPPSDVALYAVDDTILCDRLRRHFEETMHHDLLGVWKEVNEFSSIILDMMERGLQLDVPHLEALKAEAERKAADLHRSAPPGLNIASPKVVKAMLRTADTTEATLSRLSDPRAALVLAFRSWRKAVDSYYNPYLDFMDPEGVLHCQFNITGTISGRISGQDPNLLAVPVWNERQRVKEVFIPRPGFVLAEADYSMAEVRLAAHYTQDPAVLDCFKRGVDVHQMVADRLQQPRQRAKTLNFSIIYGAGADSLSEALNIPRKEAQAILYKYHDEFPGYRRLQKKAEQTAEDRGYISLWTGRRRHFGTINTETRKAFSNLIQGGVAEMMRRAMTRIWREVDQGDARMLLQVYDSILMEIREDKVEDTLRKIKDVMESQPWCSTPIKADLKVGKNWGKMEKLVL